MPAASDITQDLDRAFWWIGGVCIVLLAGITVAMLILVFRYRRSRATTTSQVEGHRLLEAVWIVIPTAIVMWMFYVGYKGFTLIRTMPSEAMVVQVTGKQWAWSFHYPEEGVDSDRMVVPVGATVRCELTAPPEDVIHSFYIPDFRVKEDALPGRSTQLWFKADREGTYDIFCAEFCGKDHAKMITTLRVVPEAAYRDWLRAEVAKKYEPLVFEAFVDADHPKFKELSIDGQALYATFCTSCHGAAGDGSGLPNEARDFRQPAGWKLGPKVVDIYRTLALGIEGTRMRAYPNFAPWEKVAVAQYLRSFLGDQAPADSRQDYDGLVQEYGLDKIQKPKEAIPIERAMELLVREAAAATKPSSTTTSPVE